MTTTTANTSPWPRRLGITGFAAAALAALGAYGSGWGLWHFMTGFAMIGVALLLAMVAAIGGLFALSRRRSSRLMLAGMAAATILIGLMGRSSIAAARSRRSMM
jgi:small-conductance mechanosensitive channel